MDPELIPIIAQLDAMLVQSATNLNFPQDELRRIQGMRAEINDRVNSFRDEMARKNAEFKDEITRRASDINSRINDTLSKIRIQ